MGYLKFHYKTGKCSDHATNAMARSQLSIIAKVWWKTEVSENTKELGLFILINKSNRIILIIVSSRMIKYIWGRRGGAKHGHSQELLLALCSRVTPYNNKGMVRRTERSMRFLFNYFNSCLLQKVITFCSLMSRSKLVFT